MKEVTEIKLSCVFSTIYTILSKKTGKNSDKIIISDFFNLMMCRLKLM